MSAPGSAALALSAAAAWGAGDFTGGVASRRAHVFSVLVAAHASGIVLLSALALLVSEPAPARGALGWAALAGIAGAVGLTALWRAFAVGKMGIAAPVAAVLTAVLPVLVGIALFPILMGDAGHHLADDMPDDETHPFYPDHFWPYPIIAVIILAAVGLMAALVQRNMLLDASADPRQVVIPRPDWYFLFLFQILKLGPETLMALGTPAVIVGALVLWPFIDAIAGPKVAKRLGWKKWPVPGRNVITGTGWVLFLGFIVMLTFWSLSGVTIFGISGG